VNALAIVLGNLAALAGAIFGVVRSGERPQVLLYAFIIDSALRLLTIEALTRSFSRQGWLNRMGRLISRRARRETDGPAPAVGG
jgi:hypothetical protein